MLRALELRKDFGGLTVLHPTSVDFRPGEVHALMGENGAGKSTLMKVLAGLYRPDGGHIEWRGTRVSFTSPHEALVSGIAMIHQELMPIPDLTVAENITLGSEPCLSFGRINRPSQLARAKELLGELEADIDPARLMRTLTVAQTQVVEIAKALGRQADVILMDEPTAALSDHEVASLFRAIARLKARGVAIVYTTHKMDEVFKLADRVSVLRDGRLVGTVPAGDLNSAKLIAMMVGRELSDVYPARTTPSADIMLEVSGLTREPAYRDVSFRIHRGEIVALAGLMGAGVAMVTAQAGIEVVLLDRDLAAAEKGKQYTADRLAKRRMDPAKAQVILDRIHPTADYADLAGCDLIIEAVFETRDIKAAVTKATEAVVGPDVIFGSNTSTLPITGLAEAWSKAENFIGIHFFSPVEKMPLVEIIVGKKTGQAAIAKALDYVAAIRKTPIVVNDSRGFYTSRCFGTYVQEGLALLGEGTVPALIENVGKQMGMPVGPLAVNDEVGLDLSYKVGQQTKADLGAAYKPGPADAVIEKMHELGRQGRKNAKGFYLYPEAGKKYLWPELSATVAGGLAAEQPTPAAVKERLLYRQLVECARCFAEGVLETPEDGDLGAIFGWGFAPFTGGPFSHMDTVGLAAVVATLDRLAQAHGERFTPPQLLRDMAAAGETFYGRAAAKKAA